MPIPELERLARLPIDEFDFVRVPFEDDKPKPSRWKQAREKAKNLGGSVVSGLCAAAAPALRQLTDHVYTVAAMVCADWAAWLWNPKSGLITAAILLIAFEIKIGE